MIKEVKKQLDSKKADSKPELYTVLGAVALASALPLDNYRIDVWNEGNIYNYIDTESGIVSYSVMVKSSCGCCHDYEQKEVKIKDLDMLMQCEILIDMYERYCTKHLV
jgi:hypothetical protein|tara:strand:- start:330 stop:653 length:324 start_codon:yes stop_codon:yes gene_type:complete